MRRLKDVARGLAKKLRIACERRGLLEGSEMPLTAAVVEAGPAAVAKPYGADRGVKGVSSRLWP